MKIDNNVNIQKSTEGNFKLRVYHRSSDKNARTVSRHGVTCRNAEKH